MNKLDSSWEGSVSCGTTRTKDLIPAFEGVLDAAGVDYNDERPAVVDKLLADKELTDDELDQVSAYLDETLFDLLDEVAPEGCYFGSHDGDGADFGFWPVEDV